MEDEIRDKINAQKIYCKNRKVPFFAPKDGVCESCHRQIFNRISLDFASQRLITGCPYCHKSYVD